MTEAGVGANGRSQGSEPEPGGTAADGAVQPAEPTGTGEPQATADEPAAQVTPEPEPAVESTPEAEPAVESAPEAEPAVVPAPGVEVSAVGSTSIDLDATAVLPVQDTASTPVPPAVAAQPAAADVTPTAMAPAVAPAAVDLTATPATAVDLTAVTPTALTPAAVEPAAANPAAVEPAAANTAAVEPAADGGSAHWPATVAGDQAAAVRVAPGPVPVADREPSPLDDFEPETRTRRWPRVLAIVGGVLVLLAGGYVGASYALGDRVPHGTTVAGVAIGGMTSSRAEEALTTGLAGKVTAPLTVVAKDQQASFDPVGAGMKLDAVATVSRLVGVDLRDPARLWRQVVGGGAVAPVTVVDDTTFGTALSALSDTLHQDAVDGTIVFVDGTPHLTDAEDGWALDQTGSTQTLTSGWLTTSGPLTLPTSVVAPQISQQAAETAMTSQATPLAAGAIKVEVGGSSALLSVATLTGAATFTATDGALTLVLDGAKLRDAIVAQLPTLLTPSADAHFDLSSGSPVVVAGTPGTTIDPAALSAAVVAASTTPERKATVSLVATDPAQSTAALEALGVKEVVGEFATPLTSEPKRTKNIANGAAIITGTLIRPGETFSLADALGPVDAAHGYVQAGAIVDGQHTDAWGGGLSQVSTTTYNAAFFAGFELVEHKPHSEYFTRYPEGREATIFAPQLDMKWKNNTPYGALVQGWVADNSLHVRIWGTKYWTVDTTTSPRRNVVPPTTVYNTSPGCEASGAGNPGFAVTVTRTTSLNGVVANNETWNWTYKPQNKTVCGPAPAG
ncbi:VanW family protein [Cellulomonas citrea]|uniref:VanW family protein n=1 Tax=Cellulomonas citrea TaxID=1909423 RepID=UPI00135A74C6|nr:VanW family protein [Cellulomonas citrea]